MSFNLSKETKNQIANQIKRGDLIDEVYLSILPGPYLAEFRNLAISCDNLAVKKQIESLTKPKSEPEKKKQKKAAKKAGLTKQKSSQSRKANHRKRTRIKGSHKAQKAKVAPPRQITVDQETYNNPFTTCPKCGAPVHQLHINDHECKVVVAVGGKTAKPSAQNDDESDFSTIDFTR